MDGFLKQNRVLDFDQELTREEKETLLKFFPGVIFKEDRDCEDDPFFGLILQPNTYDCKVVSEIETNETRDVTYDIINNIRIGNEVITGTGEYQWTGVREKHNGELVVVQKHIAYYRGYEYKTAAEDGRYELMRSHSCEQYGTLYSVEGVPFVYCSEGGEQRKEELVVKGVSTYVSVNCAVYAYALDVTCSCALEFDDIRAIVHDNAFHHPQVWSMPENAEGIIMMIDGNEYRWKQHPTLDVLVTEGGYECVATSYGMYYVDNAVEKGSIIEVCVDTNRMVRYREKNKPIDRDYSIINSPRMVEYPHLFLKSKKNSIRSRCGDYGLCDGIDGSVAINSNHAAIANVICVECNKQATKALVARDMIRGSCRQHNVLHEYEDDKYFHNYDKCTGDYLCSTIKASDKSSAYKRCCYVLQGRDVIIVDNKPIGELGVVSCKYRGYDLIVEKGSDVVASGRDGNFLLSLFPFQFFSELPMVKNAVRETPLARELAVGVSVVSEGGIECIRVKNIIRAVPVITLEHRVMSALRNTPGLTVGDLIRKVKNGAGNVRGHDVSGVIDKMQECGVIVWRTVNKKRYIYIV